MRNLIIHTGDKMMDSEHVKCGGLLKLYELKKEYYYDLYKCGKCKQIVRVILCPTYKDYNGE